MFKQHKLKFRTYSVLCSLFISLGFTLSNYIHVPINGIFDLILNTIHFSIVGLGILVLCYLIAINKYLFAAVFPLIVLLSAAVSYFVYFQNLTFTTSIIDAALHNDIRTSMDVVSFPFILYVLISFFISVFAIIYRFKYVTFEFKKIELIVILIFALGVYTANYKRNNSVWQRLPFSLYYVSNMYLSQLQSCDQPRQKTGIDATSNADSLTIVLVIGEACRADHMQLNGYARNTNPNLEQLHVISYANVFSEWTHTNASLPHFLTRSDSANHKPAIQEQSFISIFNRCGYFTSWVANQEPAPSYMPFAKENQAIIYVNPANSVYTFNKKWLDTDILTHLRKLVTLPAQKKLIVLHTIGSHWWYNDHFTDSFAAFKPILKTKNVSSDNKTEMINSYDNTIVFTDYFLSKVIAQLQTLNACMIYLSDHGESLGEDGKWLHAQENEAEKYPACVMWFSEKYRDKYPELYTNIEENKDKRWRTEFLFSSLLSIANINTVVKKEKLDITKRK